MAIRITMRTRQKKIVSEIGIYAGATVGFLRGNPAVETNEVNKRYLKLGHTFGISATHTFSERISMKAIGLLEKKGSIVKRENTYFDQTTQTLKAGKTKEDYIYTCYSFPLMFTYALGNHGTSHVSLGPYVSYIKKQIVRTTHYPESEWKINRVLIETLNGVRQYPRIFGKCRTS